MEGDGEGDYGGDLDPTPDTGDNGNDNNDSGSILDSVSNWFNSLIESITSLPKLIWNSISQGFNSVVSAVNSLTGGILDGIRGIFVPDANIIKLKFNALLDELKTKFNFNTTFFESILNEGKPVEDVYNEYYINGIGNIRLKFFDAKYLIQGVEAFRKYIRGFIVLLLAFYNIKQILSFIRQDAGVVTGKAVDMGGSKK